MILKIKVSATWFIVQNRNKSRNGVVHGTEILHLLPGLCIPYSNLTYMKSL